MARGVVVGGASSEETLKQLEQLQERLLELKKMEDYAQVLQRELQEQQRVNREQANHIQRLVEVNRQLQQQNMLLAQKCQEAGLSTTPPLSDPMMPPGGGGERPGSGGRQAAMMVGGFNNLPLHPFPGTPPYPGNPATPPNRSLGPQQQHHMGSMPHPPYNAHSGTQSRAGHHDLGGNKAAMSPYIMATTVGDGAGHAYTSLGDHALTSPISNGSSRGGSFLYPYGPCSMPADGDCKLSGSRAFSPNPMTGVDPYLDSILNLTGLPTGSGAGYGVGVTDDELLPGSLQLNIR